MSIIANLAKTAIPFSGTGRLLYSLCDFPSSALGGNSASLPDKNIRFCHASGGQEPSRQSCLEPCDRQAHLAKTSETKIFPKFKAREYCALKCRPDLIVMPSCRVFSGNSLFRRCFVQKKGGNLKIQLIPGGVGHMLNMYCPVQLFFDTMVYFNELYVI